MPREIYNEGRVVGYSAYEVYVKHAISEDPDTPPASEREWLASTVAMGSSMLLRVGSDTTSGAHYRDIQLPTNSRLCAANTIMASFFNGTGYLGSATPADTANVWATKVTDYGPLISNTSTSSPSGTITPTGTVPTQSISDWSSATRNQLQSYMQIADGVVIQPGKWSTPSSPASTPPQKDFSPTLTQYPRVRLFFADKVTTPFYVLLTGFTIRSVINGITGIDTCLGSANPQDGDFLGPSVYPWANKIIFSIPPAFTNYILTNNYTRKLPSTASAETVKSSPIIDMTTTNPSEYYNTHVPNSQVNINVTDLHTFGEGASVLTVYQPNTLVPPALYGTKLADKFTGTAKLNPIDTYAPGTIKLYSGTATTSTTLAKAQARETIHDNYAVIRDSSTNGKYIWNQLDSSGNVIPIAETSLTSFRPSGGTADAYYIQTTTGKTTTTALSMANSNGTKYTLTGSAGTITKSESGNLSLTSKSTITNSFTYNDLVRMLVENKSLTMSLSLTPTPSSTTDTVLYTDEDGNLKWRKFEIPKTSGLRWMPLSLGNMRLGINWVNDDIPDPAVPITDSEGVTWHRAIKDSDMNMRDDYKNDGKIPGSRHGPAVYVKMGNLLILRLSVTITTSTGNPPTGTEAEKDFIIRGLPINTLRYQYTALGHWDWGNIIKMEEGNPFTVQLQPGVNENGVDYGPNIKIMHSYNSYTLKNKDVFGSTLQLNISYLTGI